MTSLESLAWRDAFRPLHARTGVYAWSSPNGRNGFRLDQAFLSPLLDSRLKQASYEWGGGRSAGLSDYASLVADLPN